MPYNVRDDQNLTCNDILSNQKIVIYDDITEAVILTEENLEKHESM